MNIARSIAFSLFLASLQFNHTYAQEGNGESQSELEQTAESSEPGSLDEELLAKGEDLFTRNCKACHNLDMRLVGPALAGATDRRSEDWIIKFVQGSNAMIAAGDSLANALFMAYNQVEMPDQAVTGDEIRDILYYIDNIGKKKEVGSDIPRPAIASSSSLRPLKFTDYRLWLIYTVTVLLLISAVYFKAETEALKASQENATEGN